MKIIKIEVGPQIRLFNYKAYHLSASKNGYPLLYVHPDIKEIFEFINLKHLIITPDFLAKILLSNKIQEINSIFNFLSKATFLNTELCNSLIDLVINAREEFVPVMDVIQELSF